MTSPNLPPNAFRRGANQELLIARNSIDAIKGMGGLRGPGFRSYVEVEMDHAFRISRCLVALSDDSSSEGERISRNRADRNRRHRWRKKSAKATVVSSASSSVSSTSSGAPGNLWVLNRLGSQGPPLPLLWHGGLILLKNLRTSH